MPDLLTLLFAGALLIGPAPAKPTNVSLLTITGGIGDDGAWRTVRTPLDSPVIGQQFWVRATHDCQNVTRYLVTIIGPQTLRSIERQAMVCIPDTEHWTGVVEIDVNGLPYSGRYELTVTAVGSDGTVALSDPLILPNVPTSRERPARERSDS